MGATSFLCLSVLFIWGVRGEVSDNFNNCKGFFFMNTPVSGLNIALPTPDEPTAGLTDYEKCLSAYKAASPAHICQKYGNNHYFATMYDRGRRIPLYSAYKLDIKGEPGRDGRIINYEPQLVHSALAPQQKNTISTKYEIKKYNQNNGCLERFPQYLQAHKLSQSQAVDEDFKGYDRGHLNPAGHHAKGDASQATMTFTNVAPQNSDMNKRVWSVYETKIRNVLSKGCSNMYAVVGVVPSTNVWIKRGVQNAVNVPSYYWSAYCCTDNNDKPIKSGGAICPNLDITAESKVVEYDSVATLETFLIQQNMGNNFRIFKNGCSI